MYMAFKELVERFPSCTKKSQNKIKRILFVIWISTITELVVELDFLSLFYSRHLLSRHPRDLTKMLRYLNVNINVDNGMLTNSVCV